MPTYNYRCEACGHQFERVQKMSEDPLKECPSCGQAQARRTITSGNFILKGGGWYSDLYSGSSNKKGGSTASSSSTSTSTESTSTTSTSSSTESSSAPSPPSTTSTPSTSSSS